MDDSFLFDCSPWLRYVIYTILTSDSDLLPAFYKDASHIFQLIYSFYLIPLYLRSLLRL